MRNVATPTTTPEYTRWLSVHIMRETSSRGREDPEPDELSDVEDGEDAQHSLLRNSQHAAGERQRKSSYEMTSKGRLRAYWLGIVVCIGGFLCKAPDTDAARPEY